MSIRKLLGRKSLTTTQIYLHITITDLKELSKQHPMRKMRTIIGLKGTPITSFQSPYGETNWNIIKKIEILRMS